MSDETSRQPLQLLDRAALQHHLRRLARRPEAPWLHADIARRMGERLAVIRLQPHTLIDWWAGLGNSREPLSQAYPQARQLWVEPTEAWCERSKAALRRPWLQQLIRRAPQVEVLSPAAVTPQAAQLLWSNMMLHACPDMPSEIRRWHEAVAIDGFVMFSCLGPDSLRELRPLYERQAWGAPLQDWVDMHDIGDMLVEAGFADPVMDQERIKLTWASPESLLQDLRALGGNAAPRRHQGLRTPRWHQRLLQALGELRGSDGRISLSLEVIYGHAFKPVPRLRVAGEVNVSPEALLSMARRGVKRPN